jgi:DNA/RNA endonuclease YhcR with UshA esterase domain
LPDPAALNLGAQVSVTAIVTEFNGVIELQPARSGEDVVVELPGSSSIVTTRAINTLSPSDIGLLATIVGDVVRVESFSAGVRVFVNDGTGELVVIVFQNVLNYVPNAPSMQAGARVRVVGQVGEFNGTLELVPALGYDVTINP